jgi:hypothetical protein
MSLRAKRGDVSKIKKKGIINTQRHCEQSVAIQEYLKGTDCVILNEV